MAYQKSNRLVPLFAREVRLLVEHFHTSNTSLYVRAKSRVRTTTAAPLADLTRSISLVDNTMVR
jgi:hypothetical protein